MALTHGHALGDAVERAARPREHHLAGSSPERGFAQIERAEDVHLRVEHRPRDGHPNVELRGEVEDHFGPAARDEVVELRGAHVEPVEAEPAVAVGAGVGQVAQGPGRQVVDRIDVASFGKQPIDERRADEPRPTGDEYAHACSLAREVTARGWSLVLPSTPGVRAWWWATRRDTASSCSRPRRSAGRRCWRRRCTRRAGTRASCPWGGSRSRSSRRPVGGSRSGYRSAPSRRPPRSSSPFWPLYFPNGQVSPLLQLFWLGSPCGPTHASIESDDTLQPP